MGYKSETLAEQATGGIRALVDAVGRDVSRLRDAPEHHEASAGLAQSWAALVDWLALGPAPRTRLCPACGKTLMADATACGYCWTRLTLPD